MFSFTNNQISYTIGIPGYPVNLFVDHYVFMKGSPLMPSERLFPHNKAELFFNLGDRVGGKSPRCASTAVISHTMLSGVRHSWFEFFPPAHFCMVGMRFTLFGFHQLFKIPADHFTDHNFPADDVWGQEIREMHQRLQEVTNYQEMFSILGDWIMARLSKCSFSEMLVWQKLEVMLSSPQTSVSEFLDHHMGYSHKHSIRLIKTQSGLAPKDIQKIVRFDRALKGISQRPVQNWSGFASNAGYADQSHFIRDFKSFTGYTPGEYLNAKPREFHFLEVMPDQAMYR